MTQEDFNKQVHVGDIVTIIGTENKRTPCVVMTKTDYAVNLYTVDAVVGDDGILRPQASYYRSYDEILVRVGVAKGLYNQYNNLKTETYKQAEEDESYKKWLDNNYKFLRRFISENVYVVTINENDDCYTSYIEITKPKEL